VTRCHEVRDLKKQHYVSQASDPMSRSKRSEETTLRVTCEASETYDFNQIPKICQQHQWHNGQRARLECGRSWVQALVVSNQRL
jgi:hypothetical protein